jgi:Putative member of DMT superfamily (DUF486)
LNSHAHRPVASRFKHLHDVRVVRGHLTRRSAPLLAAIAVSWLIAFGRYCFQVPANRIGYGEFTGYHLKIIQEVITLTVFASRCSRTCIWANRSGGITRSPSGSFSARSWWHLGQAVKDRRRFVEC